MPFVIRPSRNATLQLAYELLRADERKAKRAKKEPESEPVPVKKAAKKQPAKKGQKR